MNAPQYDERTIYRHSLEFYINNLRDAKGKCKHVKKNHFHKEDTYWSRVKPNIVLILEHH